MNLLNTQCADMVVYVAYLCGRQNRTSFNTMIYHCLSSKMCLTDHSIDMVLDSICRWQGLSSNNANQITCPSHFLLPVNVIIFLSRFMLCLCVSPKMRMYCLNTVHHELFLNGSKWKRNFICSSLLIKS